MNQKGKKTIKWLGAVVAFIFTGICCGAFMLYAKYHAMPWDYARDLSEKRDTIEIYNLMVFCGCARWTFIDDDTPLEQRFENAFDIEAASTAVYYADLPIPEGCWHTQLKLVGNFYNDQGLSRDYQGGFPYESKGEVGKIFRYEYVEVLDYNCADNLNAGL